MSSVKKKIKCLSCVIDVFTKYAWVKPLKDRTGKTVLNTFMEITNQPDHKSNKL